MPDEEMDVVELRDHDPGWKDLFQLERASLLGSLGPLAMAVEHVGSTAIPKLRAKPIIDILVTVNDIRLDALEGPLGGLG